MQYDDRSSWCCSRFLLLKLLVFSVLGMGFFPGCITVGPDYFSPEQVMPDAWHQELTGGLTEGEASLETWWKALNDPVLDSLIERASAGNLDLQEAAARVMEAQARRGIATGERFPDINGAGGVERTRTSEDFSPQREKGMITPMVWAWIAPGRSISGGESGAWWNRQMPVLRLRLKPTVMCRFFSLPRLL